MSVSNEIEKIKSSEISLLKSSIQGLRNDIFVKSLKKDLQEFVRNVNFDFDKDYFVENILAPSWLPKVIFSRTQTDLI